MDAKTFLESEGNAHYFLAGENEEVYLKKYLEQEIGGELQDLAWADREFLDLAPRADEIDWAEYIRMDDKRTFKFNVHAVTTNTQWHEARIKAIEIGDVVEDLDGQELEPIKENIKTAITAGEVTLWCSDPSFKWWGFGFILNQFDSLWSSGPTPDYGDIPPDVRNPNRKRALCKHLYKILDDIINDGKHLDGMAQDVAQKIRTGRY